MFLGIPFCQSQGLDHRLGKPGAVHGQEEEKQKSADDQTQGFPDALPVDLAGFGLDIIIRSILYCFILTG